MKKLIKSILTSLLIFGFVSIAIAGGNPSTSVVELKIKPESKLWFDGTSTLHSFTCKANEIYGGLAFDISMLNSGSGAEGSIQDIYLTIPVKKIKNDDDDLNEKMYEAMKAAQYPKITFKLSKAEIVNNTVNSDGSFQLKVSGKLSISGTEKYITVNVDMKRLADGKYAAKGNTSVMMTDYGIERPTMFFGTVKTGNEIKIHFDLVLGK